jgi:probable 2-oxoglutarate dehydrogenase E1 component DHKTD1
MKGEIEEAMGRVLALNPEMKGTLERLKAVYQTAVGYEFGHLESAEERHWFEAKIEALPPVTKAMQQRIAKLLVESEVFDHFMGKRFGQVKRYALEGCESLLVAMDAIFNARGFDHAVIGMAHRGRLNLMLGLLGYPAEALFHKLQGNSELPAEISGATADVLSHLSLQHRIQLGDKSQAVVTLLPNSSHLEAVNPVSQGFAYGLAGRVLPIQVHGDAAFAGQGVVMETAQLSQLQGFAVGGTLHVTVNNQLGFTATCKQGRTARYSTDLAKMIDCPVVHVNADAPEAVVACAQLAAEYRARFGKDVFLDIIGYRRHGHNELDEPAFTQPLMYKEIRARESVAQRYCEGLKMDYAAIEGPAVERLDKALSNAASYVVKPSGIQPVNIPACRLKEEDAEGLKKIALASVNVDADKIHTRLAKFHVESRKHMLERGTIDWATAEAMAVGSLLAEGVSVRLCGQDVGRGTFSHRHWQFCDQESGEIVLPLADCAKSGASLQVVNSLLSELAVAGFEWGLSVAKPARLLPIWEAQFGDFFNGAQVLWDAFLANARAKWGLQSPLVVLLPHGFDGAGPEHSSCRPERFLQLCDVPMSEEGTWAQPNLRVAFPSTPANYFHLLRRQVMAGGRTPLVVVAPKTLLRLPAATSPIAEMTAGSAFQPVIDDPHTGSAVDKVILVSGKLYYELERERSTRANGDSIALVRIEELCPFPLAQIRALLESRYPAASRLVWCQEEPETMGAFSYAFPRLLRLGRAIELVSRPAAAAPAIGYSKGHKAELAALYDAAFN